jgi:hypothetical protein
MFIIVSVAILIGWLNLSKRFSIFGVDKLSSTIFIKVSMALSFVYFCHSLSLNSIPPLPEFSILNFNNS